MKHTVTVGNIGIVYNGPDKKEARNTFIKYKLDSREGVGRGACEDVNWIVDGELKESYKFTPKFPTHDVMRGFLSEMKEHIHDDSRATEDDDKPSIMLTIGCNGIDPHKWGWQSGDNSYTGGAYGHPIWAVVSLYRNTHCDELAREVRSQFEEAFQ